LTEEEKKAKLAELREKLAAKRAVKSVEQTQEQKANEQLRRKAGKVRFQSIHSSQSATTSLMPFRLHRTLVRLNKSYSSGRQRRRQRPRNEVCYFSLSSLIALLTLVQRR